jgi:hypothetical protein
MSISSRSNKYNLLHFLLPAAASSSRWARQRSSATHRNLTTLVTCTTWAREIPAAIIASASRNLFTICSAECLLRFIIIILSATTGSQRNCHRLVDEYLRGRSESCRFSTPGPGAMHTNSGTITRSIAACQPRGILLVFFHVSGNAGTLF